MAAHHWFAKDGTLCLCSHCSDVGSMPRNRVGNWRFDTDSFQDVHYDTKTDNLMAHNLVRKLDVVVAHDFGVPQPVERR